MDYWRIIAAQVAVISLFSQDASDRDGFLAMVLEKLLDISESPKGWLCLWHVQEQALEVLAQAGELTPDEEGVLKESALCGEAVAEQAGPLQILAIPIRHKEQVAAVAGVGGKEEAYTLFETNALRMLLQNAWMMALTSYEQEQRHREMGQFKHAVENHRAVVLFIEPASGRIRYANPAALRKIAEKESQHFFTFPHKLKDGEIRMVDVYTSPIEYNSERVLFSIIFDVTRREKAMSDVKHLAYHDHLTGLYNRRYFEEAYNQVDKPVHWPLAILIGDVNGLKMVNDSYGHETGDALIREVAERIRRALLEGAILARTGGDEFSILLKNADEDAVRQLTDKLEETMEGYSHPGGSDEAELYLSVSFGYSVQSSGKTSRDDLVKEAESHLHRRKRYNDKSMRSHMIQAMMSTLFHKSEREQKHPSGWASIARPLPGPWAGT